MKTFFWLGNLLTSQLLALKFFFCNTIKHTKLRRAIRLNKFSILKIRENAKFKFEAIATPSGWHDGTVVRRLEGLF